MQLIRIMDTSIQTLQAVCDRVTAPVSTENPIVRDYLMWKTLDCLLTSYIYELREFLTIYFFIEEKIRKVG